MKAFLFAALLLAGTAARAEDQFDLSCEGTRIVNGDDGGRDTVHLRIDLASRRYCLETCTELSPIDRVSADRIDFHALAIGSGTSALEANGTSYFDRAAGRYHRNMVMHYTLSRGSRRSTMTVVEDFACAVGPFSGFPAPAA
jgi:hypothetical protein